MKVIKKAELSSNRSAINFYQINEIQVRNWRYDKAKAKEILDIPGDKARNEEARKRLVGGGRCHFLDESSILNNILRNRETNLPVSCKMIKSWALNEAQSTDDQNFCSRFLVRNKLSIRRRTTTGQKLPTQLSQKIVHFILYKKGSVNYINLILQCFLTFTRCQY